jgi:CheY-like chemotaxis protein
MASGWGKKAEGAISVARRADFSRRHGCSAHQMLYNRSPEGSWGRDVLGSSESPAETSGQGVPPMLVRVLVVDDEPAVLELIRTTVQALRWCEVLTLTNSRMAAKCLARQKFDGVIVDAHMRDLDGFGVTECARTSPLNAGIPIVMLTDDSDINTMRRGFRAGVTFFAAKPSTRERVYRLFSAVRGTMLREQRRHHRLPFRTSVVCRWKNHEMGQFMAESLEISEGGMSLTPSGGLEVGQEAELEFVLPQASGSAKPAVQKPAKSLFHEPEATLDGPQRLRATVRYRTPQDAIGLEFISLAPACREVIRRYISGVTPE